MGRKRFVKWILLVCVTLLATQIPILGDIGTGSGDWGSEDPRNPDLDWGDAPDSYCTTSAKNGANHFAADTLYYLGQGVDREFDGVPSIDADGDDLNFMSDEDGVALPQKLVPGTYATFFVTISRSDGHLSAWIDFNCNGTWSEPQDCIIENNNPMNDTIINDGHPLQQGSNKIEVKVPEDSGGADRTYMRFRYSKIPINSYYGGGGDGEVEDYVIPIISADFGDAPAPYPTLLANGARHMYQDVMPILGQLWDSEPDGQPNALALGDDLNDLDDEDGVFFTSEIVPGQPATVDVEVSGSSGLLNAWIDFNCDGDWDDPYEHIFIDLPVHIGTNQLSFDVPSGYFSSHLFARFRISTEPGLSYYGAAPDGEVEDYRIDMYDWGDAPDSISNSLYPTLRENNGAHHEIDPNVFLGLYIDAESNGQPSPNADGDDNHGINDDDGITFDDAVIENGKIVMEAGSIQYITVRASTDGYLEAWIDLNGDGDWDDDYEHALNGYPLKQGLNKVPFVYISLSTKTVDTYARFRFSTEKGLPYYGYAKDGEVEDYAITIRQYDWGDAPNPYPTLKTDNGARHIVVPNNIYMGDFVDCETDGSPSLGATGDDWLCTGDPPYQNQSDEDGVVFSNLASGSNATMTIKASGNGYVDAWIDYNGNGSWADTEDQIFPVSASVHAGTNVLQFTVPSGLPSRFTYARVRISSAGSLSYDGEAPDGEVEDYYVPIIGEGGGGSGGTGHDRLDLDYGDAPISYKTLFADNGPSHKACDGVVYYLGQFVDCELDGQPSPDALGDDLNGLADEDGVTFNGPIIAGSYANIMVENSTNGFLNAWVDFDASGTFDSFNSFGVDEQIFRDEYLTSSPSSLSFLVPSGSAIGPTFARFRFNSTGGLSFEGDAGDGEVEDYMIHIEESIPIGSDYDWGDAPAPFPTLAVDNGARHKIVPGIFLGTLIDGEQDGQPSLLANGDDNNLQNDEDGVQFVTRLIPGQWANIRVIASVNGFLDAWIDFDNNGTWQDPGEQVCNTTPLVAGHNNIFVHVPINAPSGHNVAARFRFSTAGGLSYDGPASDGEVEDYLVPVGLIHSQMMDPTENGSEFDITGGYTIADDFQIASSGPITNLGIWAGWYQNIPPDGGIEDVTFNLSIHQNIPASESITGKDMPGDAIWSRSFGPGDFEVLECGTRQMGWTAPLGTYSTSEEQNCLFYKFNIGEPEQLILNGDVNNPTTYWVSVNVSPPANGAKLGWITSAEHSGFSSLWKNEVITIWSPLGYPAGSPIHQPQIDMGFQLYGTPDSTPSEPLQISKDLEIADHFWWPTLGLHNEMLSLSLSTASSSDINLQSIDLLASGTGDDASDIAVVNVWVDNNANGTVDVEDTLIGSSVYPVDDGLTTINLEPYPVISASQNLSMLISYSMASAALAGSSYRFEIVNATGATVSDEPATVIIDPMPLTSAKMIIGTEPIAIGLVKKQNVGAAAMLLNQEITAVFRQSSGWPEPWNWVYVEDSNRASGIGLSGTLFENVKVGDSVSVVGTTFLNDNAELMIEPADIIVVSKEPQIEPLGLSNKNIGGGAFGSQPALINDAWLSVPDYASGLNNTGLLVRTSGTVTGSGTVNLNGAGSVNVIWIDDGSSLADGYVNNAEEHSRGIAVALPPDAPSGPFSGYWTVTGIVRVIQSPFGSSVRLLVPRNYVNDMTNLVP